MNMQAPQHRARLLLATVVVLATVVLVGMIMWVVSKSVMKPAESAQAVAMGDGILVATDVTAATERSDANDRENDYILSRIDSVSLAESKLGDIHPSIFSHSMVALGIHAVYFVNADGELAFYDGELNTVEVVPVPDIKPVFGFFGDHSMKNFLMDGNTIVYFQGGCSDSARCDLKMYDFATKKSVTVLTHVEKALTVVGETVIDLQSYDPVRKVVMLRKTRNTATNGYVDLIEVDMKGANKIVKTVEFTGDAGSAEADGLFTKTLACGGASVTQKLGIDIPDFHSPDPGLVMQTKIVTSAGKSVVKQPTYVVGCDVSLDR